MVKRWMYTVITRNANEVMSHIHNDGENRGRMRRDFVEDDLSPERYKEILNFERGSEELDYYPVYTIRSPKGRPDEKAKNEGSGRSCRSWGWVIRSSSPFAQQVYSSISIRFPQGLCRRNRTFLNDFPIKTFRLHSLRKSSNCEFVKNHHYW
jgi:hypothetical protein